MWTYKWLLQLTLSLFMPCFFILAPVLKIDEADSMDPETTTWKILSKMYCPFCLQHAQFCPLKDTSLGEKDTPKSYKNLKTLTFSDLGLILISSIRRNCTSHKIPNDSFCETWQEDLKAWVCSSVGFAPIAFVCLFLHQMHQNLGQEEGNPRACSFSKPSSSGRTMSIEP